MVQLFRFFADVYAFEMPMLPQLKIDVKRVISLLVPIVGNLSNVHALEEVVYSDLAT